MVLYITLPDLFWPVSGQLYILKSRFASSYTHVEQNPSLSIDVYTSRPYQPRKTGVLVCLPLYVVPVLQLQMRLLVHLLIHGSQKKEKIRIENLSVCQVEGPPPPESSSAKSCK